LGLQHIGEFRKLQNLHFEFVIVQLHLRGSWKFEGEAVRTGCFAEEGMTLPPI